MKTSLIAVSLSLLLCACGPRDAAEPAPQTAAPPAVAAPVAAEAANADAASAPSAPASSPTVDTAAAAHAEADAAVDASIDSSLGDHVRYRKVIQELQAAVDAGDAAKVASLAQYPFGVDIAGKKTVLKNEKEFVARYQEFMTPDIRDAIVQTKYSDLFVNYKGVMFGRGQAWINGICKDDKCNAFDVKLVALQHGPE
jgi:hypothetical protein